MRFFDFTHPQYHSDEEEETFNPVRSASRFSLPGMECPFCGRWASSDRLRMVPQGADLEEFAAVRFLPVGKWLAERGRWAAKLGLPESSLSPGARLGQPRGEAIAPPTEAVVHPLPGQVWIRQDVYETLSSARLTGAAFAKVIMEGAPVPADFWEIVPLGRGWRVGSTEANLRLCEVCGRAGFPRPWDLSPDLTRWDGSDLLIVDDNPNILIATERVRDLLGATRNVLFQPVDGNNEPKQ